MTMGAYNCSWTFRSMGEGKSKETMQRQRHMCSAMATCGSKGKVPLAAAAESTSV